MDVTASLRRRAIVLEIGGFRPPTDPLASWFGRVTVRRPGEEWPTAGGAPMHALCQINLTELPFRPPRLDDIAMIALFIGPRELPIDSPNGDRWCLRTYRDLTEVNVVEPLETNSGIRAFPMRPKVVEDDFPCWEDIPIELPADVSNRYHDLFQNVPGLKLGGWPTLIQSEIFSSPLDEHPAGPEYVFQVDSSDKAGWSWGHDGVGYFGRGTAPGKEDEWTLEWQCL